MESSRRARSLGTLLIGLLLATLLLLVAAGALVRSSFPRTQGSLQLAGLQADVDVYRSADGVPHIYASNEHDLFFAQGYVHAQDRFWQMDFFRHVGSGRLAEMFGPSQVETDAFLRTLGWERLAEIEAEQLDPGTMKILTAYAEGVNEYLSERSGWRLSLEYVILGLLSPDYAIDPWTPTHTLTWAKAMAWDLGGNLDGEIDRALLMSSLSRQQVEELYPPYPDDHPVIVPSAGGGRNDLAAAEMPMAREIWQDLNRTQRRVNGVHDLLAAGSPATGSNNWVISGARTASGAPTLANDTHLGIQMPSIWYENGLHCRSRTPDCRFQVAGFSFAGVPSVVIGHNDRIAWGVTNAGPDVQDLYIERLDPEAPDQYLFEGEWLDLHVRQETLEVAGAESVPLTIRETHHGPLISETYEPLLEIEQEGGLELPLEYGLALRWTALEPSTLLEALIEINLARDWEQFRQAARKWDVPSQNLVYADVDGNIGYQMPGKIPIRASGRGWLPAEGWTGEAEWQGYIPFEELPYLANPERGYIVTANNAIVDGGYPYFVRRDWDFGYRAARITAMIESSEEVTVGKMREMQGDNLNAMAAVLTPYLSALPFEDATLGRRVSRLTSWDGQNDMDSAEAAFFNAIWQQTLNRTFFEEWKTGPLPSDSRSIVVMSQLLEQPESSWWDLPSTGEVEDRDALLSLAVQAANAELEGRLGPSMEDWRWGDLHTATFRNASLGESGVAPIEALFNRGPFSVSGGSSIVNATDWDPTEGYGVKSLPSQRLITDLSDWERTWTIHTTGQSGHAFHPNYINQADRWRVIEYHTLPWGTEAVVLSSTDHLRLSPKATE